MTYELPPDPTNATLKRIYPWPEYDRNTILSWLNYPIPEEFITICKHIPYEGEYSATPMANLAQILHTEGRILTQNIIINEIPIHQVDNNAGGRTVTIG